NGLVGRELVERLGASPEYDVLATGQDIEPRFETASVGYTALDVTDAGAVGRLFQDFAPDTVVNLAAMTNVDRCETERDRCWAVNATAVETLAKHCLRTGARLVQVSTDFVFDGLSDTLYREDDRPAPVNYYAKAKLAGENAARGAGLDRWAVARTALVFGRPMPDGRSNFVLWVRDRLQRGEITTVVTDQWRTPSYAPDVAAGLERLVRFSKTGLFHIAGREYLSVFDFAVRVARAYGLDEALLVPTDGTKFRQTAARPPRTGLLILRAETELGYHPRSLDEALQHLDGRLREVTRG
ncbi:MAG TPA: NAD(P)-dependent oxidoreductase, partial [Rhodothermales bacterium]|nr:NAD(P)-dependent oxidoreductase [Rhodothermales bacterium]